MKRVRQRCAGDACGARVEGRHHFCRACFKRLPADVQAQLDRAPPFMLLSIARAARRWLIEHRPATLTDRRIEGLGSSPLAGLG